MINKLKVVQRAGVFLQQRSCRSERLGPTSQTATESKTPLMQKASSGAGRLGQI